MESKGLANAWSMKKMNVKVANVEEKAAAEKRNTVTELIQQYDRQDAVDAAKAAAIAAATYERGNRCLTTICTESRGPSGT